MQPKADAPPLEHIVNTTLWSESFADRSRWSPRGGWLGIAIEADEIRTVWVRAGIPCWAGLMEVASDQLTMTLTRLFIWLRVQTGPLPDVRVALGPAFVRMARHTGVVVHEMARVVSPIRVRGDREWVASYSQSALAAV